MTTNPPDRQSPEGRWRVARVDTEPMTTHHYDQAVTALASLIAQWKHNNQENTDDDQEKSA